MGQIQAISLPGRHVIKTVIINSILHRVSGRREKGLGHSVFGQND